MGKPRGNGLGSRARFEIDGAYIYDGHQTWAVIAEISGLIA